MKKSHEAEIAAIEAELKKLAEKVPADVLAKYGAKRKEKLFPVVCAVADKRCPQCGMELSIAEIDKLSAENSSNATAATGSCSKRNDLIFLLPPRKFLLRGGRKKPFRNRRKGFFLSDASFFRCGEGADGGKWRKEKISPPQKRGLRAKKSERRA